MSEDHRRRIRRACPVEDIPVLVTVLAELRGTRAAPTESSKRAAGGSSSFAIPGAQWAMDLLVRQGFADLAHAVPSSGTATRPGRTTHSCTLQYIATPAGSRWLADLVEALEGVTHLPAQTAVPHWNRDSRELSVGGVVVKRFRRAAPNQERLLKEFEARGWPCEIDDPLPRTDGVVASERLRETIKRLNRNLPFGPIRFGGDGTGTRVCWRRYSDRWSGLQLE